MTTNSRITPWYRGRFSVPPWTAELLVELDVGFVPALLLDLEARKTPALSESESQWPQDYDNLCRQQEALLMNIGDRIISEVRATRNGELTPLNARDPQLDPYVLPLASLLGINMALADNAGSVLDEARAIRALLEAEGNEEILGKLDQIIGFVALLVP